MLSVSYCSMLFFVAAVYCGPLVMLIVNFRWYTWLSLELCQTGLYFSCCVDTAPTLLHRFVITARPCLVDRGQPTPKTSMSWAFLCLGHLCTENRHNCTALVNQNRSRLAPCGLRCCKNGPDPFPGWMSYKATKTVCHTLACFLLCWCLLAPLLCIVSF